MKFLLLLHGLVFGFLLAAVLAEKPAAAVPNPALANLRKAHEASLKTKLETLSKKQIASLRLMEKTSVEQQDYESAMRVQQLIADFEKSAAAAGGRPGVRLDLKLPHTCTNGAVEDGQRIHFTRTNSMIRWESVGARPGLCDVMMTFAVGPDEEPSMTRKPVYGGTITFSESSNLSSAPPLKHVIVSTNERVPKTTLKLGRFQINRDRTDFALKVLSSDQDGAMYLEGIELVPTVIGTESSAEDVKSLAVLRDDYRRQLKDKTGAAQKYWLGKLQELEAQSRQSGNTEALAVIAPELARMQSKLDPGPASGTITMPASDPLLTVYKGEIRVSNNKEYLERLRPAGARISFKLAAAKVKPGKYNVTLDMNLGGDMGGKYRVTCGASALTGTLKAPDSYARRVIAVENPLIISPEATYLEFEVLELTVQTSSIGDLRAITLTPIKD